MAKSMWDVLHIDSEAQMVYQSLIYNPGLDDADRAATLGMSGEALDRNLAALERHGLVRRVSSVWQAGDPRTSLLGLARHTQAVLDQAGPIADELGTALAAARLEADPYSSFQVLRGPVEIVSKILDLFASASEGVQGTVAPPYIAGGNLDLHNAEVALLHRGVTFQALYDGSVLNQPEFIQQIRELVGAGEIARVSNSLSAKFLIVDGMDALVPLARTIDRPEPTAIHLGPSAVTDLLVLLFDRIWADADDVSFTARDLAPGLRPELSEVLALLALGLDDGPIAETLGISDRTLRRRMITLLTHFRAANRTQLGIRAAPWLNKQTG